MDARSLLRAKKAEARIEHPYAAYNAAGQLRCSVCAAPGEHLVLAVLRPCAAALTLSQIVPVGRPHLFEAASPVGPTRERSTGEASGKIETASRESGRAGIFEESKA